MSVQRPIKYQLIQLAVPGIAGSITIQTNTDKLYKRVTGIHVTSSDANGLTNSTFDKFEIDGQEIYPEGFEAKLINTGQEVNPNEKFDYDINERAEESVVNIGYTDGGSAAGAYTLNVYLRLENPSDSFFTARFAFAKSLWKLLTDSKLFSN